MPWKGKANCKSFDAANGRLEELFNFRVGYNKTNSHYIFEGNNLDVMLINREKWHTHTLPIFFCCMGKIR